MTAQCVPLAKSSRNLYVPLKLSLHKIHNDLLAITGTCPDDIGCPFCMNDRAERHAPNPGFCYTPERCAGKTCCPHNPSCTE